MRWLLKVVKDRHSIHSYFHKGRSLDSLLNFYEKNCKKEKRKGYELMNMATVTTNLVLQVTLSSDHGQDQEIPTAPGTNQIAG